MKKLKIALLLSLLALILAMPATAAEVIKNMSSAVSIREDSVIEVTEKLVFNVENVTIKRGILRSLPVYFKNKEGRSYRVGLDVTETLLDGAPTPCEESDEGDFTVLKIGDPEKMIQPGEHTFIIKYSMTHQIGFFDNFDELYWNAVGTGFKWPVLKASCTVRLPEKDKNVPFRSVEWYVGFYGEKGNPSYAKRINANTVATTRALSPDEAFTVVYTWPKGLITEPPSPFGNEGAQTAVAAVTLLALLLWTLYGLFTAGAFRSAGTIVALFHAPDGVSPAFARYIRTRRLDDLSMTSDIIDLGVHKALTINESGEEGGLFTKSTKLFTLKRGKIPDGLPSDETALFEELFPDDSKSVSLDESGGKRLGEARSALYGNVGYLGDDLTLSFSKYVVTGVLIYAAGTFALVPFAGTEIIDAMIIPAFAGFIGIALSLWRTRKVSFTNGQRIRGALINLALMLLICFVFSVPSDGETFNYAPALYCWAAALLSLIGPLTSGLNKKGQKLYEDVAGLYLYITVAEKDRMEMLNAPEETPELYERLLPYAVALGAAKTWGDRFAEVLEKTGYEPQWYSGPNPYIFYAGSGFYSSFNDSLGSAVTAGMPKAEFGAGTSSGSGGGGFSGGGGGGGGASGW